jgi:hypothetical protein
MFKQWLCASIFFAVLSIDAAYERPLLQRVCREVAKNVDAVAIERGVYAGLATAAVLFIMHDGISDDTNSNECNMCQADCGVTLVATNGGPVTCVDQQQHEVISLAQAFCPIL